MRIKPEDVTAADVIALLEEHLRNMALHSPPESVHALDVQSLQSPKIRFWTVRSGGGELMGCGALKRLDDSHAEIKSMRTAAAHLRKGVARELLIHILDAAGPRDLNGSASRPVRRNLFCPRARSIQALVLFTADLLLITFSTRIAFS